MVDFFKKCTDGGGLIRGSGGMIAIFSHSTKKLCANFIRDMRVCILEKISLSEILDQKKSIL